MDDTLLEHLLKEGVPTFAMSSGLTLEDFGWGSPVCARGPGRGGAVYLAPRPEQGWHVSPRMPQLCPRALAPLCMSLTHIRSDIP